MTSGETGRLPIGMQERFKLAATTADLQERNQRLRTMVDPPTGGNWRKQETNDAVWVLPGQVVTQYGTTKHFRPAPRFDDVRRSELSVSMAVGVHDVEELTPLVTGHPATNRCRVRYFATNDLYLCGYLVLLSPNKTNPNHASVHFRQVLFADAIEKAREHWSFPGRVTLDELALTIDEVPHV